MTESQQTIEAPQPPRMNISLPRLSEPELYYLATWATAKLETFPTFAPWLRDMLVAEIARREFQEFEPEMVALPNWNGTELADALLGAYVLAHFALNEKQAGFVDELLQHCVANSCAALQQFSAEVQL